MEMQDKNLPILVVEDEDVLLKLYVNLLSKDYHVLTAASGKEAFEIFQNTPEIAVVLTDVYMENETAGIELINRISKIKPSTQFIIVSSFHEDAFIALQTLKGVASLPKPIDSLHVRLAVKSACIRYKETIWLEELKVLLERSPWLKHDA
jgi:hypothetical protein